MKPYDPLRAELDRWWEEGQTAALWLRDDDATDSSLALELLLNCIEAASVPAVLAVIPMLATEDLATSLRKRSDIVVWQHGVTHENNVSILEKRQELADGSDSQVRRLTLARARLNELFAEKAHPVLVPPWNRIAEALVPRLPEAGLLGLSTYKPRERLQAAPGVWQVNTHVDVINWRSGRQLRGVCDLFQRVADHLEARRSGKSDPLEPTGILTHHRVMDSSGWDFLSDLFALTNSHPAARWCVPSGKD